MGAALIVWTRVGYAAALAILARLFASTGARAAHSSFRTTSAPTPEDERSPTPRPPSLSLIVAAHDEQAVIAAKVANALALDYPRELLEVIVACDGCADATAAARARRRRRPRARAARAAARSAPRTPPSSARAGEIVAFSDANVLWEPDALRAPRRRRSPTRASATSAGRCASCAPRRRRRRAPTRRGCTGAMRWRCARSSRGCARSPRGNGAIYATRRDSYLVVDPIMGHDLSFPFNMVKRGWRAVYVPGRARDRADGPLDRGRARAQAAHDEPHLADRAARRDALPARLPPGVCG